MIAHVPLFVHPRPRRVLVIGGGDGGPSGGPQAPVGPALHARRDRRGWSVEACRKFIPQTASALDDPRVTVTIADGVEFVAKTDESFDVVLVDSTDPIGPAQPSLAPSSTPTSGGS